MFVAGCCFVFACNMIQISCKLVVVGGRLAALNLGRCRIWVRLGSRVQFSMYSCSCIQVLYRYISVNFSTPITPPRRLRLAGHWQAAECSGHPHRPPADFRAAAPPRTAKMYTGPVTAKQIADSVVAVPPLARHDDLSLDYDANKALCAHLTAGACDHPMPPPAPAAPCRARPRSPPGPCRPAAAAGPPFRLPTVCVWAAGLADPSCTAF
eukprot:SAG22_NODE_266_length_13340_cov_257.988445_2_plen_210_part_00